MVHVLFFDGSRAISKNFPSREVANRWLLLQAEIKTGSEEVRAVLDASGGRYDSMSREQRAVGDKWLLRVNQLRQMGYGLPPSIELAESNYQAIMRGEQV
jgi:hypothetical protein